MRPAKCWGVAAVEVPTIHIVCAPRTPSDARLDGVNDYKVLFQVFGRSTLFQDEWITELAEGDLGLIDAAINLVAHQGPGRWIGLHLPGQSIKANLGI